MAWQIPLLASPGSNCSYVKNPSIPSRKSFLTEASLKWASVTHHQKQQKLSILTQLLLDPGKTSLIGPAATSQAPPVSYATVVVFAQSHPTLCDPMNSSTPGFSVLHYLLELAQTHVHWVGDAIQPSHPLSLGKHKTEVCPGPGQEPGS